MQTPTQMTSLNGEHFKIWMSRVIICACFMVTSCGRESIAPANSTTPSSNVFQNSPNRSINVQGATNLLSPDERQWNTGDYEHDKKAALDYVDKLSEERMRNPPTNEIHLPNYSSGPGNPRPIGINFYIVDQLYPGYLICLYDVEEIHYDPDNEPAWFKESLLQVRGHGREKLPFKWIVVVIRNGPDFIPGKNLDPAFKAGAVFNADDIFDMDRGLVPIIKKVEIDHNPYHSDLKAAKTRRWMIVERHASTNSATH